MQDTPLVQPSTLHRFHCRSHIRETMVKIMLHPVFRERPALGAVGGEAGQCDDCGTGGGFGDAFGREELPVGPSTCIFWCAVALGGLVKGSPIESVSRWLLFRVVDNVELVVVGEVEASLRASAHSARWRLNSRTRALLS